MVDERAEGETVSPAGGHIVDFDPWIAVRHPATPKLQSFHAAPLSHDWIWEKPKKCVTSSDWFTFPVIRNGGV